MQQVNHTLMVLKLKDIKDNPRRDVVLNPLNEEVINDLVSSIHETGFWSNVAVRKNEEGHYELLYGHHRLRAAMRAGMTEAQLLVRECDRATATKIMDAENRVKHITFQAVVESVQAYVRDLHEGVRTLEKSTKVNVSALRYAPHYAPGRGKDDAGTVAYTKADLQKNVGFKSKANNMKVDAALLALELLADGVLTPTTLRQTVLQGHDEETKEVRERSVRKIHDVLQQLKRNAELRNAQAQEKRGEFAEYDAEQRSIIAEQQQREAKAKAERDARVRELAETKWKDSAKKALELREEIKLSEKEQEEKAVEDAIRILEIDARVAAAKQKEAAGQKKDEYAPIRSAADGISRKVQIEYYEALHKEMEALARKDLSLFDRDKLRGELQTLGDWFSTTAANLFLPPISVKKHMAEYRQREESKRRAIGLGAKKPKSVKR